MGDPGDTGDDAQAAASLADASTGEERGRLAARAYHTTRIEIDDVLRHNWLEIWYQPKVDLRRRTVVGAEGLARIRHPDLGVLLPQNFLASLSDGGMAHLTEHAVLAALRDWSVFDAAGFNLKLAVNVPIRTLERLPIAKLVMQNRPNAKHWPGLILDVPEEQIASDLDVAQKLAAELRIAHMSISVDDFGVHYGAFVGLSEPVFAEFKIDNSFVKNCAVDVGNAAICQTAIDLAHGVGIVAVAEGVEGHADLQALQLMGCDFGQGVVIAPPMPMANLLEFLHQRLSKPILPEPPSDGQPTHPGRPLGVDRVA
jgi:EAL domain-containing protein (putative c-di-GMP-specific phosphodiesterase class I)